MKSLIITLWLCCLCLTPLTLVAHDAKPLQMDQQTEKRVQQLFKEFRCLVCQNQTLADSHADLAKDLKNEIRTMAAKGMGDEAITHYLVTRYGEFVRYRPAFNQHTALLWIGPFVLLLLASIGLFLTLRKRQANIPNRLLTADDQHKVDAILKEGD